MNTRQKPRKYLLRKNKGLATVPCKTFRENLFCCVLVALGVCVVIAIMATYGPGGR